jgi:hypothetical protein
VRFYPHVCFHGREMPVQLMKFPDKIEHTAVYLRRASRLMASLKASLILYSPVIVIYLHEKHCIHIQQYLPTELIKEKVMEKL